MSTFKSFMASIEKVRVKVRDLQTELSGVFAQTRSRQQVDDYVTEAVTLCEQQGMQAIEIALAQCATGQPADFLTLQTYAYTETQRLRIDVPLGPILVALLGADVVRDALLERLATVPVGLEPDDRVRRMTEIRVELDSLGYEEEGLMRESWAAGEPVDYRADMDPHHVLTWKGPQ